jgi:hypothetical protein
MDFLGYALINSRYKEKGWKITEANPNTLDSEPEGTAFN